MMEVHWGEVILGMPHCKAQVGSNQQVVFKGPRIKMGLFQGVPGTLHFDCIVPRHNGCVLV